MRYNGLVRGLKYHMRCLIESTQGDTKLRTSNNVNLEDYQQTGSNDSTTIPIMPTAPQSTTCVRFNFESEPGDVTRTAIINHCQRVFSAPGWENNGCIICVKPDLTGVSEGLAFSENTTCVKSSSKRRLRFLQGSSEEPSPKSGDSIVDVAAFLTVCAVPDKICPTDATGNKTYNDYITQFRTDLSSNKSFKDNLNIDNVLLSNTDLVTDAEAPDMTKLVIGELTNAIDGSWSVELSIDTASKCYWQLSDGAQPSFKDIKNCTDPSWCGSVQLGPKKTKVKTDKLKAFSKGTTYNAWAACNNDVPNASKDSVVVSVGKFTTEADQSPVSPVDPVTPVSAGFINASIFGLLLIIALIFN